MEDIPSLKAAGAQMIDVRTPAEFARGHAAGSLNIPLDELPARLGEVATGRAILVCCASGARSGVAKQFLEQAGYPQVHNAGPWTRLNEETPA
jgi:rhodanese-related sulfurtransferase